MSVKKRDANKTPPTGRTCLLFTAFLLSGAIAAHLTLAQEPVLASNNLKQLTLEELMNVDVTTTARQPEPLWSAASAIQVIGGEEVRRSGASSLAEALRLAPNLQVAEVDSRQWAISARGFNNTLANKLLVMIDGRMVYTPLFAGVFWDAQDIFLPDLDRIEVVSGPGATLWGANAVNGMINIITKSAKDTQGAVVEAGAGTFLQDFAGARYGFQLTSNVYARVYGKYFDRESTLLADGKEGTNDWRFGQSGFRVDWFPAGGDLVTVQADGYAANTPEPQPSATSINGNNIIGRWTHPLAHDSDFTLQMYWDRTFRGIPGTFREDLNTYDIDFQHRFPLGERQELIWGAGYRVMLDRVGNSPGLAFLPPDRNLQLFSGFLQDSIKLIPEHLEFTVGSKLEHNDYSGWEIQPSGRLAWSPDDKQTIWAAISRAVRSPSRIDTDFFLPPPPVGTGTNALAGGPRFDSEKLLAYELGYRVRPFNRLSLSLSTFYNSYDDIRSTEFLPGSSKIVIANGLEGESWGAELAAIWQVTDTWRLRGGYTYFHKNIFAKTGRTDLNNATAEGDDPDNQVVLQSMLDLPCHFQFDLVGRYVDRLPVPHVPAYFSLDARLAWQMNEHLELSVVGQNLCDNQHPEFGATLGRQEIPRSAYGKVTWRF